MFGPWVGRSANGSKNNLFFPGQARDSNHMLATYTPAVVVVSAGGWTAAGEAIRDPRPARKRRTWVVALWTPIKCLLVRRSVVSGR